MNILAIETCFGKCSICFFDGTNFHTKIEEQKNTHRNSLPKMLEELMVERNFTIDALHAIVVNHGPGTFTGIRIGIAFALGLAIAKKIPIYGISTMEAVILQKPEKITGVVMKAIGNFCYYQKFDESGNVVGEPVYVENENIEKTAQILTNCEINGENIAQILLPNAENFAKRFLFIKPNLFEKPLYLRQAI